MCLSIEVDCFGCCLILKNFCVLSLKRDDKREKTEQGNTVGEEYGFTVITVNNTNVSTTY